MCGCLPSIANLAQTQAQHFGGQRSIEPGFPQRTHQYCPLLGVQVHCVRWQKIVQGMKKKGVVVRVHRESDRGGLFKAASRVGVKLTSRRCAGARRDGGRTRRGDGGAGTSVAKQSGSWGVGGAGGGSVAAVAAAALAGGARPATRAAGRPTWRHH